MRLQFMKSKYIETSKRILLLSVCFLLLLSCGKNTISSSESPISNSILSEINSEQSNEVNSEYSNEESFSESLGESVSDSESDSTIEEKQEINFTGVDDVTVIQGEWFNPISNVKAVSTSGKDISSLIKTTGFVDIYTPGEYTITYQIDYQNVKKQKERKITVLVNSDYKKVNEPYVYTSTEDYVISRGCNVSGNYKDQNSVINLTDGDKSTRYESIWEENTSSVVIDLGACVSFTKIVLAFEAASASEYEISVSNDGINYTDSIIKTSQAGGAREDIVEHSFTGRYVKFNFLKKMMTNYGYSLYEIEIYGKQGISIPLNMYPELYQANEIFDEQYLDIDFESEVEFDRTNLSFRNYLSAKSYDILYGDDLSLIKSLKNNETNVSLGQAIKTKKLRFVFHSRPFSSRAYMISNLALSLDGQNVSYKGIFTASSYEGNFIPQNANYNYGTFWSSKAENEDKIIDLNGKYDVGNIDIKWTNNNGKIYDVLTSNDGINYSLVYRQIHGATQIQTIPVNQNCRYISIHDYSNSNKERYQIESLSVHSKNPSQTAIDYVIPEYDNLVKVHNVGKGSYNSNDNSVASARYIKDLDESLMSKPVPSNGWWQSLMINDLGHAMYLNPLRVKYYSDGMGLSSPRKGYFETTYNRSQTVSNYVDMNLGFEGSKGNVVVKEYSDMGVISEYKDYEGHSLISSLNQGSLSITSFFDKNDKLVLKANGLINVKDIDGEIITNSYEGKDIIINLSRIEGYENNSPIYEDRHYLLSCGPNSSFIIEDNKIIIKSTTPYLTISDIIEEANALEFVDNAFVLDTSVNYEYIEDTSDVKYDYSYRTISIDGKNYDSIIGLIPHLWKKSSNDYENYNITTVRGKMKFVKGNNFTTKDHFSGLVPQFSEPNDETYSRDELIASLQKFDKNTQGSNMSEDAYWQGKSLHPLANAAMISNIIGDEKTRDVFLTKLKSILIDWYTYSGEDDKYYFTYDNEWKTLYYKVSEFGANTSLSDHHFTYGYFAFASAILCEYDQEFLNDYGDFIEILIKDYMNYDESYSSSCRFRNYDFYAGHSWAGGYADSDGGNNQESAGEALNSWYGAYLYSIVSGNKQMRDAAICGYVTELNSIKQYWFDYDNDIFDVYPYEACGQVYGGSNFYGTFFNGDPTYIYGIQWLPGGEFLTSYAIGENEKTRLKEIYDAYLKEELNWTGHQGEDGYQHILWVILAIENPEEALNRLNDRKNEIINNNEYFNVYYLIHSMASMNNKVDDVWSNNGDACSFYQKDNQTYALVWNPSNEEKTVEFYNANGKIGSVIVPSHSLIKADVNDSDVYGGYFDYSSEILLSNCYKKEVDDESTKYYFRIRFSESEQCSLNMNVINTTDKDGTIIIKDEKGNELTRIIVPKDDNLEVHSEKIGLYLNQSISIELSSGLVSSSFNFK